MEQDHLFLTMSQAVTAICLDFRGYGPQAMLFCEILRTLPNLNVSYNRESGKEGLWISDPGHGNLRWMDGDNLVAYMCDLITGADLDPDDLALICRRVFQAPCRPTRHPETGERGLLVHTDMASFECRQCGRCCRKLDYRDGITQEDVEQLKQLGRTDVLEWMRPVRNAQGQIVYRIWVIPGTNQFAHPCPFLKRGSCQEHWICSIHEVKPHICRNYPVSRKHALMTGCPGFDIR
jgi:Fe-S-cluster containining protein